MFTLKEINWPKQVKNLTDFPNIFENVSSIFQIYCDQGKMKAFLCSYFCLFSRLNYGRS
jgi:hypothetical protein